MVIIQHTFYIHYDARVTLKTYLPVKRIGNKFLVLPGHHNGYAFRYNHLCAPTYYLIKPLMLLNNYTVAHY